MSERHRDVSIEIVHESIRPMVNEAVTLLAGNIGSLNKHNGLLIMGAPGVGKTSVLALLYREYLKSIISHVAFMVQPAEKFQITNDGHMFIDEWDQSIHGMIDVRYMTHAGLIKDLRKYPDAYGYNMSKILFLDDFGAAFSDDRAGWNRSLQDDFFDYRWKNNMPTYISTNFDAEQLNQWDEFARVIDRFADKSWMTAVTIPGGSLRRIK